MKNKLLRCRFVLLLASLATLNLGAAQANAETKVSHVPYSTTAYLFTVESDIVYGQGEVGGEGAFKDLELDLYIPTIPVPAVGINVMPLMLMIHGGGFLLGSKTDATLVASAREYAGRGWLVAAINYRLILDDPVPSDRVQPLYNFLRSSIEGESGEPRDRTRVAAIDDTLTALDFLRARSDVKKAWTTIWGNSSGGNTALATSFALDDHNISRPRVSAVIELAGRFDDTEVGNPFDHPATSDPVLLSVIGTADPLYPYSLETRSWAIDAGQPINFQSMSGEGHDLDMFTLIAWEGVILFQRTVDWHHETIFEGLAPGQQPPPTGC
jgi:acetyl esterase/lipase